MPSTSSKPDELRVDLDPTPDASFGDVREVALMVRDVLGEHGLTGFPKTSGSKGMHIYIRIEPRWTFPQVRRAALGIAREVEDRIPHIATTAWWKEERHGVFIDYNQNARDHTIASAYSVRPTGWVSAPLSWEEVPDAELADFPMAGFATRYERFGDLMEQIDEVAYDISSLLDLADNQEEVGRQEEVAGEPN